MVDDKDFSDIALFEDLGKLAVIVGLLASAAVFTAAFRSKEAAKHDYYDTLRKSYEGLSPEDY